MENAFNGRIDVLNLKMKDTTRSIKKLYSTTNRSITLSIYMKGFEKEDNDNI
jgi:hypothetical protein